MPWGVKATSPTELPSKSPKPEPGPRALACYLMSESPERFPSRQCWVKPDRLLVQKLNGHLVVVLYDSISGGAGYATRLTQEDGFQARDLLMAARKILDCPNPDCLSSCTRCLNDYSNQRFWPDFERWPALAWLEAVLINAGVVIDSTLGHVIRK